MPLAMVFIKHLIKGLGYDADYATSAEEALMMCYENQYDLILNDIKLPKMDGLAMSLKIRQFERKYCLNSSNIVMITSHSLKHLKEKLLLSGVNAAITKPVKSNEMLNIIKACEGKLVAA